MIIDVPLIITTNYSIDKNTKHNKISAFHGLVTALSSVEESSFKEPPSVILRL